MTTKIYKKKYETASQRAGLDGIVVVIDGYDASQRLRCCNAFKLILSCKIKQMKAS